MGSDAIFLLLDQPNPFPFSNKVFGQPGIGANTLRDPANRPQRLEAHNSDSST